MHSYCYSFCYLITLKIYQSNPPCVIVTAKLIRLHLHNPLVINPHIDEVKVASCFLSRVTSKCTFTLPEKCPNTEVFLVHIFLYSVQIQENTDQKRLRIWTLFTQCQFSVTAILLRFSNN